MTTTATRPRGKKRGEPEDVRSEEEIAAEKRKGRVGLYLIIPGMAFLALFFAAPVLVLLSMSLYTKPPGAEIGEFVPALQFSNYTTVITAYWDVFLRSFFVRADRHRCGAADRVPHGVPGGGAAARAPADAGNPAGAC